MPSGAVAIDVGPDGKPWVVASDHSIERWTGSIWVAMPGAKCPDWGIELSSDGYGRPWVIGGDHSIWRT